MVMVSRMRYRAVWRVTLPAALLAGGRQMTEEELADLLIVSQVETGEHESVTVTPAQGAKCERCWKILPSRARRVSRDWA